MSLVFGCWWLAGGSSEHGLSAKPDGPAPQRGPFPRLLVRGLLQRNRARAQARNPLVGKDAPMKKSLCSICLAALLGVAIASCSGAPKQSQENATATSTPEATTPAPTESAQTAEQGPIARGRSASLRVTLSVEAVDHEKRLITLKGPQ